jgi:hypothetical protein
MRRGLWGAADRGWAGRLDKAERDDVVATALWTLGFVASVLTGLGVALALQFVGSVPVPTSMIAWLVGVALGCAALVLRSHHLRRVQRSVAARLGIDPHQAKRIDRRGRERFDATTQKLTSTPKA